MLRLVKIFAASVLALGLDGCISTHISQIEVDPGFDWDALKRDEILMTPLFDLRKSPSAPEGFKKDLTFFSDSERLDYPQEFKKIFARLRHDIRVFGAGGAFENMLKVANLKDLAERVVDKIPLEAKDVEALKEGNQAIRFIFFFAITDERLGYDVAYQFRSDQEQDRKIYQSKREFVAKMGLWDSLLNKTVWLATQNLTASEDNAVGVSNPTKRKKKSGSSYYWTGETQAVDLKYELSRNRDRFPNFPKREPAFHNSFDDFALALPLQQSEAKLIEYEHFTYHRPEAALRLGEFGKKTAVNLQLGTSSIIYYHLRLGGALDLPLNTTKLRYKNTDYHTSMLAYGVTADYEWQLGPRHRLLAGALLGGAAFTMKPTNEPDDEDAATLGDGAFICWPSVNLLFGDRSGFQWGVGGSYRFFDGIEEGPIREHRPSVWSADLNIAYATRGF